MPISLKKLQVYKFNYIHVHICVHPPRPLIHRFIINMKLIKKAFKIYFPDINYHLTYAELKDGRYATAYNKDNETIVDTISKQEFDAALVYNLLELANKKEW